VWFALPIPTKIRPGNVKFYSEIFELIEHLKFLTWDLTNDKIYYINKLIYLNTRAEK